MMEVVFIILHPSLHFTLSYRNTCPLSTRCREMRKYSIPVARSSPPSALQVMHQVSGLGVLMQAHGGTGCAKLPNPRFKITRTHFKTPCTFLRQNMAFRAFLRTWYMCMAYHFSGPKFSEGFKNFNKNTKFSPLYKNVYNKMPSRDQNSLLKSL